MADALHLKHFGGATGVTETAAFAVVAGAGVFGDVVRRLHRSDAVAGSVASRQLDRL